MFAVYQNDRRCLRRSFVLLNLMYEQQQETKHFKRNIQSFVSKVFSECEKMYSQLLQAKSNAKRCTLSEKDVGESTIWRIKAAI